MEEKVVKVQDLKKNLHFEQLTGDEQSLKRCITVPDTNRPGLEFTGYYHHSLRERIVMLGTKELSYINSISEEEQNKHYDYLTHEVTPCIVITRDMECPQNLFEIATKKNFPILRSKDRTYRCIIDIVTYLDEQLAESISKHGVLMQIYGKGVLITGESGMGKSEVALELIKRGHLLVADDRVDCSLFHKEIIGQAPEILKDFLEIRGIGIINVPRMFGFSSVLDKTKVDLMIHLEPWDPTKEYARVGIEDTKYENILGIDIPKMVLPVKSGRSMAAIIESAVTNHLLKCVGFDSAKEFDQRIMDFIVSKNKNGGND